MTSPKHLWSGDWERESDGAAASREPVAPRPDPAAAVPPVSERRRQGPSWDVSGVAREMEATRPAARQRPERARGTLGERLRRLGGPRAIRYRIAGLLVLVAAVAVAVVLVTSGNGKHSDSPTPNYAYNELGLLLQSVPVNRVIVTAVKPGSPAEVIGIGASAVLQTINGTQVTSPAQVNQLLAKIGQGHQVTLGIVQGSGAGMFQLPLSRNAASP